MAFRVEWVFDSSTGMVSITVHTWGVRNGSYMDLICSLQECRFLLRETKQIGDGSLVGHKEQNIEVLKSR